MSTSPAGEQTAGTTTPVLPVQATPPGGIPMSVLARYTVTALDPARWPALARLPVAAGRPVLVATCRRPHTTGGRIRDGEQHIALIDPAGMVSDNLADLAGQVLDHEVRHHGDPLACTCAAQDRAADLAAAAGRQAPLRVIAGYGVDPATHDPGCPMHGDPATALGGLVADAAEQAMIRFDRAAAGAGFVDPTALLASLRDAAATAAGYTATLVARQAVAEQAGLRAALVELPAGGPFDGVTDVLDRVADVLVADHGPPPAERLAALYETCRAAADGARTLARQLHPMGRPPVDEQGGDRWMRDVWNDTADALRGWHLAVRTCRKVLEAAGQVCRYHGDAPPRRDGRPDIPCEMCRQPAAIRATLALIRCLSGETPPPRRYTVRADERPHQAQPDLYRVEGVNGLWAPANVELARALIGAELEARGEVGPFNLVIDVRRPATD